MLYLETRFVNLLRSRLIRFRQTDTHVYNMRCPYCGDSQKKQNKTRGYIYERGGHLFFYCHNCFASKKFTTFLRDQDPNLYSEFIKESFDSNRIVEDEPDFSEPPPVFTKFDLPSLATLPDNHIAKAYVRSRLVPEIWNPRLYYAEKFFEWARKYQPEKYKNLMENGRLIIPFAAGFQGRALNNHDIRYINVATDKTKPFLFGLDWLVPGEPIYALEGPFDAMFLPNGIASGGGNIIREIQTLEKVNVVFDNEPRNSHIVKAMLKAVNLGFPVCIWPDGLVQKDVNEMILAGFSAERVKHIIDQSMFFGSQASVRIGMWARCSLG